MKRIRINTGKIGLVFRNGNYKRVVTEGVYWLLPNEDVFQYDMTKPFHPSTDLNILLKDEQLANMLTVVEVRDNEIVLQYENGNFKNVLGPGRYAYWKGVTDYAFIKADLSKIDITENIDLESAKRKELVALYQGMQNRFFRKGYFVRR